MTIEGLQRLCADLPSVTEEVKWEHDLCFCVGGKIFLMVPLELTPTPASFKVADEEFEELLEREGFRPAPYLARYQWVAVEDIRLLRQQEWQERVAQSYQLVRSRLPKKIQDQLNTMN
ncbi:MAG: MmcQ/YjbR family DNA-binding protein [Armatimonadetes bacterium]|nr:MmcQ/YjbR family DNA-binding protein [Armatimonadota bacterium]